MPPSNIHFICSESLSYPRLQYLSGLSGWNILQKACICNHSTIVDRISLVDGPHVSASLLDHLFNHILEPYIASYPADNNHLFWLAMAHSPFSYLHQHREDSLLKGKTKVFKSKIFRQFLFDLLSVKLIFVCLSFSSRQLLFVQLFVLIISRFREFYMGKSL